MKAFVGVFVGNVSCGGTATNILLAASKRLARTSDRRRPLEPISAGHRGTSFAQGLGSLKPLVSYLPRYWFRPRVQNWLASASNL